MGNHRADRRGASRRPSGATPHAGKRIAGRSSGTPASVASNPAAETTTVFFDHELTAELPLVDFAPGKRKAVKHSGSRGPLFKTLPSVPVLLGVATLAVAIGGAVTTSRTEPEPAAAISQPKFQQASALSGVSGSASTSLLRRSATVSRDSQRDALSEATDTGLVQQAEQQARQRDAALAKFAQQAQATADQIALNQWVYPTSPVELTAEFGDYGLWASYHTGLDFNGDSGDNIMAVANGVITSVGYDGSYGYKTVMTLEDGTEIWYAHQTSYIVSEGDVVQAGEVIGYIGATGNVTGSHLHLEVRPGGGDPVDPYAAMVVNGLF